MKFNQWTVALATAGVVSFAPAVMADESPVSSVVSGVILSGYVDTSAVWNFGDGRRGATRFVNTGPDRQDGFNLNVVQVALEKPLDDSTWAAGYRTELWFGPDAGGFPGNLGGGTDLAIKQAYVALRAPVGNGIDFKIGQFDAIIGYEVASSYANPNFSRSLGFNNLEPFAHTGVLATYQFTEWFGAAAGVANKSIWGNGTLRARGDGLDPRAETQKSYMGAITLKAPDDSGFLAGSSLYAGVTHGAIKGAGLGADKDSVSYYVGASVATPVTGLTAGAAYDYAINTGGDDSDAWAAAAYLSYQATEQVTLNYRGEIAKSDYGAFGGGVGDAQGDDAVLGNTFTVNYALWANTITRLEFRWDRDIGGDQSFGKVGGSRKDDLSLILNVIYTF